jgi:hypothetical protein
MAMGQLT